MQTPTEVRLTPEQFTEARRLLALAFRAEHATAWEALDKAKTIDEMREAMLGVWFEIEVPAPAEGPRVWLLPHVFGDVCLHLPGATRLRIKAQNVRKLWDWIHATGQVQ